jgi:hypothetical protein
MTGTTTVARRKKMEALTQCRQKTFMSRHNKRSMMSVDVHDNQILVVSKKRDHDSLPNREKLTFVYKESAT